MTWSNFLLCLVAFYLLYYALIILFDLFKSRAGPVGEEFSEELFFDGDIEPQLIIPEEPEDELQEETAAQTTQVASILSGIVSSTGAIGIKELFALAQSEVIEYTKAIPY